MVSQGGRAPFTDGTSTRGNEMPFRWRDRRPGATSDSARPRDGDRKMQRRDPVIRLDRRPPRHDPAAHGLDQTACSPGASSIGSAAAHRVFRKPSMPGTLVGGAVVGASGRWAAVVGAAVGGGGLAGVAR